MAPFHPRARRRGSKEPLLVEVGGIEPPSHEALASASPSAANSDISEHEDSVSKHPHALSGIVLPHRSRNPGGGVPHCVALTRRGGHPPEEQERLSTLPVRYFRLHLYVYRLFNEDSGDLGSLPAPQLSRSKPCHPRICGDVRNTSTPVSYPANPIRRTKQPRSRSVSAAGTWLVPSRVSAAS